MNLYDNLFLFHCLIIFSQFNKQYNHFSTFSLNFAGDAAVLFVHAEAMVKSEQHFLYCVIQNY